jgi:hypothetical protein
MARLTEIHRQQRGRRGLATARSVRPTPQVGRPPVGPTPLVLSCGGCQVGPQGSSRCPQVWRWFGHVCGPYNPCDVRVVYYDSLGLSSLD